MGVHGNEVVQLSAVYAPAACDHDSAKQCESNTERLKELLMQQAVQHERLNQEVHAHEMERWQLVQLLKQKDEQLAWQEEAVARQRAVVAVARDTASYFRVVCTLRAWRDYVQRSAAQRALSRAKNRCTSVALRHACSRLSFSLRGAVERRLSGGMQAIWFHAALRDLETPSSANNSLFDSVDLDAPTSTHHRLPCQNRNGTAYLTPVASHDRAIWSLPTPAKGSHALPDTSDDQVLFGTPVRNAQISQCKPRLSREVSPRLNILSHRSDVSTCAPSSSSSQSRVESSVRSDPLAAARLSLALDSVSRRRIFWAMGQWRHHNVLATLTIERRDEMTSRKAIDTVEKLSSSLSGLDSSIEQERQIAIAGSEALRARCKMMESRITELAGSKAAQKAALDAAQVREQNLEKRLAHLQDDLGRQRANEHEAVLQQQRSSHELRLQIQTMQENLFRAEQQQEKALGELEASKQECNSSEQSCAKLEAKLAKKASWRSEAERQIRDMVSCGEDLERECARLRQKLSSSKRERQDACENAESLRHSLEQEEQLAEILKARTRVVEEDVSALKAKLQHERSARLEDASRHRADLRVANQEESAIAAALAAAESRSCSEAKEAQRDREDLLASWSKERKQWSSESAGITSALEQQVATLREDLKIARHNEKAEFDTAQKLRCLAEVESRHEESAIRKAVRAELSSEAELCRQMQAQLEHRLAQAQELKESFEERAAAPLVMGTLPAASPPATPQLAELDEYAQLVERLRVEISREREEKEAATRSLESLRSSYRLLLQRVSSGGSA